MSKYSICLRYLYSKFNKSNGTLSETELRNLSKNIENIDSLPNYFIVCATKEAISTWKSFQPRIEEHEKTRDSKLKKL